MVVIPWRVMTDQARVLVADAYGAVDACVICREVNKDWASVQCGHLAMYEDALQR